MQSIYCSEPDSMKRVQLILADLFHEPQSTQQKVLQKSSA